MRIIISPAKKMNMDTDSFPFRNLPQFLPQAEHIYEHLKQMDYGALKALWNCNNSIARLNAERLSTLNLRQNLTPAILAYEGIQYRYMAPHIFTSSELEYIEAHLRILSGLYGLLRPFDGVIPYRLEMQAKLQIGERPLQLLGQPSCLQASGGNRLDRQSGLQGVQRVYLPPFNQKCAPSYLRVRGTKERPDCGEGDPVQNGQGRDGAVFGRETERAP